MDVTEPGEMINKDSSPPIALVDEPSFEQSIEAMLSKDKLVYRDTFTRSGSFLNRVSYAFGPPWLLGHSPKHAASTLGRQNLG